RRAGVIGQDAFVGQAALAGARAVDAVGGAGGGVGPLRPRVAGVVGGGGGAGAGGVDGGAGVLLAGAGAEEDGHAGGARDAVAPGHVGPHGGAHGLGDVDLLKLGQDEGLPAEAGGGAEGGARGERVVGVVVGVQGDAELLEVVLALQACGGLADLLHG